MTLSPLASRLIAWGLLANLCWAAGAFVAAPLLRQMAQDRETIASSNELLARYRHLEASLPAIEAQLDELQGRSATAKYFFASASPALAAAEMQNSLRGLVTGSGALLRNSKSLQAALEKGFDRIGLDLDLTASAAELSKLLRAIAGAEPIVVVERLFAQVPETGATATAADGQPALSISLRLVSYARRTQAGVR
ncbi:general secretion pathway protein M [Bradyrhizobium sp. USDA 3397]